MMKYYKLRLGVSAIFWIHFVAIVLEMAIPAIFGIFYNSYENTRSTLISMSCVAAYIYAYTKDSRTNVCNIWKWPDRKILVPLMTISSLIALFVRNNEASAASDQLGFLARLTIALMLTGFSYLAIDRTRRFIYLLRYDYDYIESTHLVDTEKMIRKYPETADLIKPELLPHSPDNSGL